MRYTSALRTRYTHVTHAYTRVTRVLRRIPRTTKYWMMTGRELITPVYREAYTVANRTTDE